MELKGIDSINCTSLGKNKFRKTSECQLLEPYLSMRPLTYFPFLVYLVLRYKGEILKVATGLTIPKWMSHLPPSTSSLPIVLPFQLRYFSMHRIHLECQLPPRVSSGEKILTWKLYREENSYFVEASKLALPKEHHCIMLGLWSPYLPNLWVCKAPPILPNGFSSSLFFVPTKTF